MEGTTVKCLGFLAITWLSFSAAAAEPARETSARLQLGATVARPAEIAWAPDGAVAAAATPQGSNVMVDTGPVRQVRTTVATSGGDVRRFLTIEF
jgi:hypothetical protein